jgi:tetratricopeptide (TPR) repeat protein
MSLGGIALAIGAGLALRFFDEAHRPEKLGFEALRAVPPDAARAAALYREALERDPANAYRWADLASALAAANDLRGARVCFNRALELSGEIPAIWLRIVNFHFQMGESKEALDLAVRVLKTVPFYDVVLFNYFDRLIGGPPAILPKIAGDRRAVQSYLRHLVGSRQLDAAGEVFRFANERRLADRPVTVTYVNFLVNERRYADAQTVWKSFLGAEAGGFPDRNLVFNGGFERELDPKPVVLDWKITPAAEFETARDPAVAHAGSASLRIRFLGGSNVNYANIEELTAVAPGNHVLEAWIKTADLSTNEGVRLQIVDAEASGRLDLKTDSITGTRDWTRVSVPVAIPAGTRAVRISLIRLPSEEFDNRIRGTVWVDDVRLTP